MNAELGPKAKTGLSDSEKGAAHAEALGHRRGAALQER